MRLTKIKLAGFKSFVDPTTINMPSNLIGIVGPNGCGKSNVIDAVRWVMGESSAKQLRGESMADVIFNGSSSRKPVGHATIELVFDNSDGGLGGQYASYAEIAIKRQVSRDAQSVYFLNGTRCRRRDITDIFLGTGLGPRSYAIIEQGMISRLIEAKPEELRVFLEEAAGISKYKERRKETESRIHSTRENMARLTDVRDEIEKQLTHLQRQAKAAEKYKELKQEERQVKAESLALRLRGLEAAGGAQERAISERETRLEAAIAEQRAMETAIEKARDAHAEANDAFNAVQGRFYAVGSDIARVEQAIQHAKDTRQRQQQDLAQAEQAQQDVQVHIEADSSALHAMAQTLDQAAPALEQARLAESEANARLHNAEQAMHDWQAHWDDFNQRAAEPTRTSEVERARIDQFDRHLLQLEQRRTRLEEERATHSNSTLEAEIATLTEQEHAAAQAFEHHQQRVQACAEQLSVRRDENLHTGVELNALRSQHQDARGRLVSLQALQQAALGRSEGAVNDWLSSQHLDGATRLAQQVRIAPEWERALETVLGDYLEAVCVDGIDPVAAALPGLQQGSLLLFDAHAAVPVAPAAQALPTLLDKVETTLPLGSLLSGVYCAETLQAALALRPQLAGHESVISRDGIWLGRNWLRVARDIDERQGVLAREKELAELQVRTALLAERVAALGDAELQGRETLVAFEQQRDAAQHELNSAHRQLAELQAQLGAKRNRVAQAEARHAAVQQELAEIAAQISHDQDELRAAHERLKNALDLMETNTQERAQLSAQRDELRHALDASRESALSCRNSAHELALRIESQRAAKIGLEQNLQRMQEQLIALNERSAQLRAAVAAAEEPLAELAQQLEGWLAKRVEVEAELTAARHQREHIEESLRDHEQQRHDHEQFAQELRAALEQQRLAWQEIKVRRQTLMEQLAETGMALQTLLETLPPEADEAQWQENLDRIAARLQRLGPINLAAIDEFAEQSQRKIYLDAQHADLTEALDTLENAIRKIDRETRVRFQETFDKVNGGLQAMFPRLFGGGQAHLELIGDDLLDTGIAIMARPPGKRISNIHLLSGGEKALTAVALVFAIFELNPSPFCMLDEVDAPLDDANVGRFCALVREMSERVQFIYITHNKTTMEMANQLTGVTMHEAGVSRLVSVDVDEAVQLVAS
ncbi:MAG: chromosome segregation protein SMC [Gammaproteobacteria bacterium]